MKATYKNTTLAQSDETVLIEGNHYFPPESVNTDFFSPTDMHTTCPWKGEANYYSVEVDGDKLENAAWYYPNVSEMARERVGTDFANYVAFYPGKVVVE